MDRWGDEAVSQGLKPRTESEPDKDGIRTIVSYRHANVPGMVEKVTQRVKTVEKITRTSDAVTRRRAAPRFGIAATHSGENVTYVAVDDVFIEAPDKVETVESLLVDPKEKAMFSCRHCGKVGDHWTRMCPFKDLIKAGGTVPEDDSLPPSEDGPGGMGMGGASGSYVPPAKRGGATQEYDDDDSKRTLKVLNLSREAEREDLYDLFGRYGSIERITLVRDRETNENRGMAFVCFRMREDAVKAQAALHRHTYGYQLLAVEWAKPRTERQDRSLSEMKVSGYGKALPQGIAPGKK